MVSCLVELSFHAAEGLSTRQEHVHGKQHLHPGKRDKFNQNFLKNLCHGWIVHFFFFDYLTIIGRSWAKYRDLSAASRSVICRSRKLRQIINLQDTCWGWGPCFLVSRPFRWRDEFFFFFLFFFYCTKSLDISYWSDSHEVTTFERLTTYIYILVCTDWFALSE